MTANFNSLVERATKQLTKSERKQVQDFIEEYGDAYWTHTMLEKELPIKQRPLNKLIELSKCVQRSLGITDKVEFVTEHPFCVEKGKLGVYDRRNKIIGFADDSPLVSTFIHEFTHFISNVDSTRKTAHGKDFIETLEAVWEEFYDCVNKN